MRSRAWVVIVGVAGGVGGMIGCPQSNPPPVTHDSGVCALYDFGIDETSEASVDAIDAAEAETETEADAGTDAVADSEAGTDADDGALADASDADAAEATSLPGLGPKVCRSDVENIVFVACSLPSCHGRFPDGQGGLYIGTIGDWTQNVVNVTSKERKDLKRVKPGDPKNSWLAHKLVGDQCMFGALCVDGDCGDQMPATGQFIGDTDLNVILEWIRQGADTTTDCSGGTP